MRAIGQQIGRAKMVLVFGTKDNRKGVMSTVVSRVHRPKDGPRLSFTGTGRFSESTVVHIQGVILPIVDHILERLGLQPPFFEVSVVNVGAASSHDLGIQVSGFSADAPVFLAMLSAALRMPLRGDLIATGHIASIHGDIAPVKGMPAKLAATVADPSVERFIYGSFEQDRSLDVLSPGEKESGLAAIMQVHDGIRTKAVAAVDELVEEAFAQESTVLSSLQIGFYHICRGTCDGEDPVSRVVRFLTDRNDRRFWRLLQQDFAAGECDQGTRLLKVYAQSFLRRREYPTGFGSHLLRLICSLPPAVRRLRLPYPLLDLACCAKIAQFAKDSEIADVPILFDAVRGKMPDGGEPTPVSRAPADPAESECDLFDTIAAQIDELTLARKFAIPVDSARASYVLASSTVASYDEFIGIVESFFVHLQTYTSAGTPAVPDAECVADRAMALLNETFRSHGGAQAAYAQARDGTEGGIRAVLDSMTEQYKTRLQADHVAVVLEKAVAAMSWPDRIRFTQAAMNRLRPFLPAEIRDEPPERFARQIVEIAKAYARSTSPMQRLLSTM